MDMDLETVKENHNKPPKKVKHADLKRVEGDESPYRSECPFCKKGVLLISRDPDNDFRLRDVDSCIRCGRRVIYTDIEDLREKLG